ncbi:MAG: VPLPA-CTERM sorting domain-containing protein [Pseudomonadota bacterium]
MFVKHGFFKASLASLCLMAAPGAALAVPTTYLVEEEIGLGGLIGFIETDGTLGTLNQANIIKWSLEMIDGANSVLLLGDGFVNDNSGFFASPTGLSATADELRFDFDNTDSLLVFHLGEDAFETTNAICYAATGCAGPKTIGLFFDLPDGAVRSVSRSGNAVIATSALSAVPLPAGAVLLLTALGGIALVRRA